MQVCLNCVVSFIEWSLNRFQINLNNKKTKKKQTIKNKKNKQKKTKKKTNKQTNKQKKTNKKKTTTKNMFCLVSMASGQRFSNFGHFFVWSVVMQGKVSIYSHRRAY